MDELPICARLRAIENSGSPMSGPDITTCWHRNPDGPAAADIIEQLVGAHNTIVHMTRDGPPDSAVAWRSLAEACQHVSRTALEAARKQA